MTHPRNLSLWAVAWSSALMLAATGCNLSRTEDAGQPPQAEPNAEPAPLQASADGQRIDEMLAAAHDAETRGDLSVADETYARVLAADPMNPQAQEGQTRVRAVGGIAPPPPPPQEGASGDTAAVTSDANELEQARREQVRMDAENRIKQGEVALQAGDFEKAIQNFEDALLIVRYRPYLVGGDLTEGALESRIESAKSAKATRDREAEIERKARIQRANDEREAQERAQLEFRIRALFEAANAAYVDDRFAECENYLTEVLRLDPENTSASTLRDNARDARAQAADRKTRDAYKRNWRSTFDEITENMRPQMDKTVFPSADEWRKIASRGPLEFTVQDNLVSPGERAILDKLKSANITLNFTEAPLSNAIDWFRVNTGVNFLISSAVTAAGDEPTFTLNVGPMPALDALDLLLSLSTTPLARRIESGVVRVMTKDEVKGGQILEIYDVRDLTMKMNNFPGKEYNLTPSGYSAPDAEVALPEPQPYQFEPEKLVEVIKGNIAKDSWDADPGNTIVALPAGALVVHQTPEVHAQIRTIINDFRRSVGTTINVEARFVNVNDQFLEDIGVDLRGLGPADEANPEATFPSGLVLDDFGSIPTGVGTVSNPVGIGTDNDLGVFFDDGDGNGDIRARVENLYDTTLGSKVFGEGYFDNGGGITIQAEKLDLTGTFLDETMAEAILRAVSKYGTRNVVDAPALTVYNGQRASMNVTNFVTYVKDFDVEIAQGAAIADPIVEVIEEGVALDVRPVVSSDRRFITMEVRPSVNNLRRPIATFTTSLGIGTAVTIELPELTIQRAKTTVTMPDGSTLMIGGWKVVGDQDFDTGIPFVNKIPILNTLLGRKGKYLNKQKLVILIKATIVIPEENEPAFPSGAIVAR